MNRVSWTAEIARIATAEMLDSNGRCSEVLGTSRFRPQMPPSRFPRPSFTHAKSATIRRCFKTKGEKEKPDGTPVAGSLPAVTDVGASLLKTKRQLGDLAI